MKSEIVTFGDDKRVTVRELTVKEIKELFDMPEDVSVIDRLTFLLDKSSSGTLKHEELLEFSPSELEPLIKDMLRVNESFFDQAEKIGMSGATEGLKKMIGSISMIPLLS